MEYFDEDLAQEYDGIGPETDPHLVEFVRQRMEEKGRDGSRVESCYMQDLRRALEGKNMRLLIEDHTAEYDRDKEILAEDAGAYMERFEREHNNMSVARMDDGPIERFFLYGEWGELMAEVDVGETTVRSPYTIYAEITILDESAKGEAWFEHPQAWAERVADL